MGICTKIIDHNGPWFGAKVNLSTAAPRSSLIRLECHEFSSNKESSIGACQKLRQFETLEFN